MRPNPDSYEAEWMRNVRSAVPYTPGEQPGVSDIIKLNTNENPFPPAPGVLEALEHFDGGKLCLYPDPGSSALKCALAQRYGVSERNVFVGVGSDDVLAMSFLTFFNGGTPILFPDITYSFYDVWAELFRIPYRTVPLKEDWSIDPADYLCGNGGIIFANPNAPTGCAMGLDGIEEIVAGNPSSVVISDEAYVDFGAESALPLTFRYDNLLVVQTFSKSRSLAGLRIGFAIGSEQLIACLENVRNSFNSYTMSRLTIELGTAAVKDEAYFQKCCEEIIATREWAKGVFRELGFECTDSKSNFLFVSPKGISAEELFGKLRERRIFVRYFSKERIRDRLRVTVGTRAQMEKLFEAIKEIISEKG